MSTETNSPDRVRPWIASYPEGIEWQTEIDTTPVHEQVLAACARNPSAVALDFLGGTTTFGELAKKIVAFAGALQSQYGVKKGSRVALMLPNTPFYSDRLLRRAAGAGGTVVNCNPLYTVPELSHITRNAGADILITLDLKQIPLKRLRPFFTAGHVKSLVRLPFP